MAPHAVNNTPELKLSPDQILNVIAGLQHRTPENNWDALKSNSRLWGCCKRDTFPENNFSFVGGKIMLRHYSMPRFSNITCPSDLTRILCWDQKTSAMHMQSVMLPHIKVMICDICSCAQYPIILRAPVNNVCNIAPKSTRSDINSTQKFRKCWKSLIFIHLLWS